MSATDQIDGIPLKTFSRQKKSQFTKKYIEVPDFVEARIESSAIKVDDYVYILSGHKNPNRETANSVKYNITTKEWLPIEPIPGKSLSTLTSFSLGNTIYTVGGSLAQSSNSPDVLAYNTSTDTWARKN